MGVHLARQHVEQIINVKAAKKCKNNEVSVFSVSSLTASFYIFLWNATEFMYVLFSACYKVFFIVHKINSFFKIFVGFVPFLGTNILEYTEIYLLKKYTLWVV